LAQAAGLPPPLNLPQHGAFGTGALMEHEHGLDGRWLTRTGECVATVHDGVVCWVDGPCGFLNWRSPSEVSVKVEGVPECCARLECTGELTWNDGDVWVPASLNRSSDSQQRRRSKWQAVGGSGGSGAGGGDSHDVRRLRWSNKGKQESSHELNKRQQNRFKICASTLLPDRCNQIPSRCYTKGCLANAAAYPFDGCRYSAFVGEGTVVRLLAGCTTPSFLVFELNANSTYNMMDANLSWDLDWACDTAMQHMNRSWNKTYTPIGCMAQGAGPHFCPGGNPQGVPPPGMSAFDASQYCGYHPFIRIREMGIPIVVASHGAQVGGGCAYALNATTRVCAHNTTISFGNVSRGAVPGMMLSRNVMTTLDPPHLGGMLLYLTDSTLSAFGATRGGFIGVGCVGQMPQGSKTLGLKMLKQIGTNANAARLLPMQPFFCETIFSDEGAAINIVGKSGTLFQSVDAKARAKYLESQASSAASLAELEGGTTSIVAQIPRPDGMPSRLPGQHLKGLRPGEQAVCVQCGRVAEAGVWGPEKSDFDGMFFCWTCWCSWGEPQDAAPKKKGRPKRKPRPVVPPPPKTLPARAAALHAATVDGGILSWATYSSKCCWACMDSEAKFVGNDGGKMKYCSVVCKDRHHSVYKRLLEYKWAPTKATIEVEQLVEACSFVLWRERCYGTGVVEIREAVSFDKLSEYDPRRALQSEPHLNLKDSALPLLVVQQGEPGPEAMLFDDPKERLPGQEDVWWQFVGTETSRMASALLVSSMLACIASERVALVLNGKEVSNFGICRGDYVGPVHPLVIEDRSRGSVFTVPRRSQDSSKLLKHDWVFVQTSAGQSCIDLAAAQFGNKSRGRNGCPSVFLSKAEFDEMYTEESRDEDPVEGYREVFQDMLAEKELEMKRVDKPWYKRVNHLEVFVCISGKVCNVLGLV